MSRYMGNFARPENAIKRAVRGDASRWAIAVRDEPFLVLGVMMMMNDDGVVVEDVVCVVHRARV